MTCQYCHSNQHNINNCPNIICRYCKEIGHPKWLCKNKDNKDNKENELTDNVTENNKNLSEENDYSSDEKNSEESMLVENKESENKKFNDLYSFI